MKKLLILVLLLLSIAIGFLYLRITELEYSYTNKIDIKVASPTPTRITIIPTIPPLNADNLFKLVNSWRTASNYQPYIKSDFACNIASQRLPEIKVNWSHAGFSANRFCPPQSDSCTIGENLARNYLFAADMLQGWLISPTHRANLEASYTHSCIKCDSGYCVQIFSYF